MKIESDGFQAAAMAVMVCLMADYEWLKSN